MDTGHRNTKTKIPPTLQLCLTDAAKHTLAKRSAPLIVYLELLFSCMIRKRVLFPDIIHPDALPLDSRYQNVQIWFRAVGTKTCLVSDQPVPDLQTFPIRRIEPFVPRWVTLDFKAGRWQGEFGYI